MTSDEIVEFFGILIKIMSFISSLSFLSCMIVIFLYLTKRHLRTFVMELLFHLSISETFNSIAKFMSIYKLYYENEIKKGLKDTSSVLCVIQRVLGTYSDIATFFLISVISYTLYDIMMKGDKTVKRFIPHFRVAIYTFPTIVTLSISFIPKDPKTPDRYQCWCWVTRDWIGEVMYAVYFIFLIVIIYICCKTANFLKNIIKTYKPEPKPKTFKPEPKNKPKKLESNCKTKLLIEDSTNQKNKLKIEKVIKVMYIFPKVAIGLWLIAFTNRMYEFLIYSNVDPSILSSVYKIIRLILYSIHAIVMSARGLIYVVMYVFKYEKMKIELVKSWRSITRFCRIKRKSGNMIQFENESKDALTEQSGNGEAEDVLN